MRPADICVRPAARFDFFVQQSSSSKFRGYLKSLEAEITRRFQDFKKVKPQFSLLSSPFTADVDAAPDDLQLELIDIQADHTLQLKYNAGTLIEFYNFSSWDKISSMKSFAAKMFCIFGSTYIYEQSFSCMKINKNKNRCSITDQNLPAVMRILTSDLTRDYKRMV